MIILVYVSIVLLMIGTYNMICYFMMLPTANAGRYLTQVGTGNRKFFADVLSVSFSEMIVRKWDLKWNHADAFEELLTARRIYTEGTTYLISRFILLFSVILWVLPMFFVNRIIFWSMILVSLLWGVAEALKLIQFRSLTEKKYKRKLIDITCKLLPGAFFIAQILLLLLLLT